LARKLCGKCKEPYEPTADTLIAARYPWKPDEPLPTLHRAKGCGACAKTGYKGRLALHEVMSVSEAVEKLTVERASSAAIEAVAHAEGMASLRLDGMHKVSLGITSLEEILRVVV
jgi:type IV pilus assembly protein PilB